MTKTRCFTCGGIYNAEYGTIIKFTGKGDISNNVTEYYVCEVCGDEIKTMIEHRGNEEE